MKMFFFIFIKCYDELLWKSNPSMIIVFLTSLSQHKSSTINAASLKAAQVQFILYYDIFYLLNYGLTHCEGFVMKPGWLLPVKVMKYRLIFA